MDDDEVVGEVLESPLGRELAQMAPGPELAATLDGLDIATVDDFAAVEVIAAYRRLEAWSAARLAKAAAQLASRDCMQGSAPTGATVDFAPQEIGMRLGIAPAEARRAIRAGQAFGGVFAPTGDALEAGRLDWRKALTIVESLDHHPGQIAWAAQWEVLDGAGARTHRQLVKDLAAALIAADAHDAADRHRRAAARRRAEHLRPLPDGMAAMHLIGPAQDLMALDIAADAAARHAKTGPDARTHDQLRFDAVVAMANHALATGWIGTPPGAAGGGPLPGAPSGAVGGDPLPGTPPGAAAGGRLPGAPPGAVGAGPLPVTPLRLAADIQVHVTVPLGVALPPAGDDGGRRGDASAHSGGLDVDCAAASSSGDAAGPVRQDPVPALSGGGKGASPDMVGDDPLDQVAVLAGYGPITAEVARALAAGGTWRRLVTDPVSGTVLDVGRTTYRPPADLARHVRARDGTCVRPGCTVPAQKCQLDHTRPYAHDGRTADFNLGSLCSPDHAVKTAGGYRLEQPAPGTFIWTTPTGHRYRRNPDGTIDRLDHVPRYVTDDPDDPPPF